jgi:hypothetical protein
MISQRTHQNKGNTVSEWVVMYSLRKRRGEEGGLREDEKEQDSEGD